MIEPTTCLIDAIRTSCGEGAMSYREFIDLALYHPDHGYYTAERQRVGRTAKADFYTAESLGPVFSNLVVTAAEEILGPHRTANSTFIEIGAEPESGLLSAIPSHPFSASRVIRQSDPVRAKGDVVIFANEWLDALPFHRLIFHENRWRERGVCIDAEDQLNEVLLDELTPAVRAVQDRLPIETTEGYEIDLPLEAESALNRLIGQDWTGLIMLFDYGKSWAQLTESCPAGTARSFHRHQSGNDLLAQPGQQDLTCDLCWDPLQAQLKEANFDPLDLATQESFFVRHAARTAERIVRESAGLFSTERQTLMELLHPAHMGRRFQVLWGRR